MFEKFEEPNITINDTKLTTAQALTVRVAIETFAMRIDFAAGTDPELGPIGLVYLARIEEIRRIMYKL